MTSARRAWWAVAAVAGVVACGTLGYRLLGLSWLDAGYQTVTTVTTVGFREVGEFGVAEKAFTIVLILVGVGTVLYTITAIMGLVLEGDLLELLGRRRMDRKIAGLSGHVVLCGFGRVGRALAEELAVIGAPVVVIDRDGATLVDCPYPAIQADASSDEALRQAGVERAATLAAALQSDADNLFVTLSGRALNAELFIVARARDESSVDKLLRAGADRVVNPQRIGGARMAAFVVQPNVAEFLDVVMHDRSLELRLGEAHVGHGSRLVGTTLEELPARVLARRRGCRGPFETDLGLGEAVEVDDVLIAVGTDEALAELRRGAAAAADGVDTARRRR